MTSKKEGATPFYLNLSNYLPNYSDLDDRILACETHLQGQ